MKYIAKNTVEEIIELANLFFDKDNGSGIIPSSNLDSIVKGHLLDSDRIALENKVSSLSKEEIAELECLVILGQGFGDETLDDWDNLYLAAKNNNESVRYILKKKKLSSYLRAGLTKVQQNTEL
ncbi:DUF3775 domain-containing protein [Vibrio vulnificus]|uniref:DUF3775 domain-containing protein n=1 Tax=Vibrio vulnificus TaxID=672 RepID=UPI00102BA3E3|nr:DUF3775 domain-containing protein [Vibrio vulnificus]EHK9068814.1 DUF3775 domain-containing protein [Vibrio vulnificus]EHZ2497772.1 DUF3775 domain-containing protein [Vibrio vulnificus]EIV8473971.1 DUF3775 domain-containing protein [Vibrio vulnificus]EJN6713652.1 DUF3775 domain-containing protein [Vibrio vulnificus]ELF0952274.1 DUF3775 domain-containing protein [Vibrio vulnificus]